MPDVPAFEEVISELIDSSFDEVHTMMPGKLIDFDESKETATVRPLVHDVSGREIADIPGVHVAFSGPYWKPASGETGIIIFSESDFSAWWRTGDVQTPPLAQRHDLNGAVFILGLKKKGSQRTFNGDGEMIVPGSAVRLGSSSATEKIVKGTAYTGHEDDFLADLAAWIVLVEAGIVAGGGTLDNTAFTAAITAFRGQLPGDLSDVSKTD